MTPCNGKTALVTGASRGIGRASRHRARQGRRAGSRPLWQQCRRSALGRRSDQGAGGRAEAVGVPIWPPTTALISSPLRCENVVGDRLDILVANAGISKAATIEETTVADFDALFAVNVRAPYFLVQQLLPILKEGSPASSSPPHSPRMRRSGISRPMPRRRARSTPWSSTSP